MLRFLVSQETVRAVWEAVPCVSTTLSVDREASILASALRVAFSSSFSQATNEISPIHSAAVLSIFFIVFFLVSCILSKVFISGACILRNRI